MVRKRSGLSLKVRIFTITAAWTQWSGMQNSVLVPLNGEGGTPPFTDNFREPFPKETWFWSICNRDGQPPNREACQQPLYVSTHLLFMKVGHPCTIGREQFTRVINIVTNLHEDQNYFWNLLESQWSEKSIL